MSFSGDPEASSSSRPTYPNRVFLSFRGEDTRLTFTGHLYTALMNAGLQTFKDDIEINRGETIKLELERGIQQSSVSLIVFSKDYASSPWCLNELVMILEHSKASQHVVIPLFYDVEPANVRHQTGSIGEAFDKYERKVEAENNTERRNKLVEDIGRWRAALREAADISGFELKKEANRNEAIFVQQVVAKVQIILKPRLLNVDSDKLVGMGLRRLKDIDLWIKDADPNATIMLICGMGGIGKTTIARKVYNDNHIYFGGCSFLSRVSERSKQYNDLVNLQKQLLSDIYRTTEDIHSKDEGFNKIRDVLRFKKVLVLDDVNDVDQLEDIFKMQGLSPGSKIIVTTRNVNLKHYNEHYKVHEVAKLGYSESVELFSLHAFRQNHPTESYMENVKKIVSHCEGLPLALKVLGCSLYKKEIDIWEDQIKNLDANPNIKIVQKLEISFNLQEDDVKNVFLYIACFFVGENKNRTIEILNACDQMMRAVYGIDHLVDVCLLEIDFGNTLRMHQLIKDMGRYIVHKESLDEPGERSRLWHSQDCFNVLRDKTGTRKVKALAFDMQIYREHESITFRTISRRRKSHARNSNENILETDAFAKMQSLLYIKLSNVELSGRYADFPKKLGWLCWHRCHLARMPSDLSLRKLVCLEMRCSSLKQLWEGPKDLPALKILDLSHSLSLATSPDFSEMPNLERLILEGCTQLLEVCESIEYADGLVLLNLRDCKRLSKLPRNTSMLQSLKELDISGCSSLSEFPDLRKLDSLEGFNASRVDMSALVSSAQGISCVASFPQFIQVLSLESCKLSNDSFPKDMSNLSSLKRLNLSGNLITSLPECCGRLGNLEYLNVTGCSLLESVVGLPNILKSLLTEGNSHPDKEFEGGMDSWSYMSWEDCPRLAEIEGCYKRVSIRDVERGIIKKLGLMDLDPSLLESDLFDNVEVEDSWGTLSTFLPLDKLPGCFRSLEVINNVNVTYMRGQVQVPDKRNNIQGLTLGFLYHDPTPHHHMKLVFTIFEQDKESNKKLEYFISKNSDVITRDGKVVWLLHINFRKPLLQPGDVIHFFISTGPADYRDAPQGVGIYKVVYDEEEEDDQEFDLSFPYPYFRKSFSLVGALFLSTAWTNSWCPKCHRIKIPEGTIVDVRTDGDRMSVETGGVEVSVCVCK